MDFYILWIGIILIIIGYLIIIIEYLKNKNNKIKNITGFDLAKEITTDYDNINIIESKEIIMSDYRLKRNVIRLTKKTYESNNIFYLTISTYLSCISLTTNKYIKQLRNILPSIVFINKSPILLLIISYLFHSITDAKIGIIIGLIILIYQYYYLQIISDSITIAKDKKIVKKEIIKILEKIYQSNTIFFISTLTLILRFIIIIIH